MLLWDLMEYKCEVSIPFTGQRHLPKKKKKEKKKTKNPRVKFVF